MVRQSQIVEPRPSDKVHPGWSASVLAGLDGSGAFQPNGVFRRSYVLSRRGRRRYFVTPREVSMLLN